MVVAGLRTFCASQLWLSPEFCPMEPERFARSLSVWTWRSSVRWAKTTGDMQLSDLDLLPTVSVWLKLLATTSATSAGQPDTASGRLCTGMAKGADAAMRAVCEAAGKRESMDAATVRVEFMGRLAAVILTPRRGRCKNVQRSSAMVPRLICQPSSSVKC